MNIIDGATAAKQIKQGLKEVNQSRRQTPGLAIIVVGENPDSLLYANLKEKAMQEIGGKAWKVLLPEVIAEAEILSVIYELNAQDNTHGIIVLLPLPPELQPKKDIFLSAIDPLKDVDGFHPQNRGLLIGGRPAFISCAARSAMDIIKDNVSPLSGKKILLAGDSFDLCMPLSILLGQHGCKVMILPDFEKEALDWCEVAVIENGYAGMIKKCKITGVELIIDAGFYYVNGRPAGNIDASTIEFEGSLAPVPGGLGPILIAQLLKNVTEACVKQNGHGLMEL